MKRLLLFHTSLRKSYTISLLLLSILLASSFVSSLHFVNSIAPSSSRENNPSLPASTASASPSLTLLTSYTEVYGGPTTNPIVNFTVQSDNTLVIYAVISSNSGGPILPPAMSSENTTFSVYDCSGGIYVGVLNAGSYSINYTTTGSNGNTFTIGVYGIPNGASVGYNLESAGDSTSLNMQPGGSTYIGVMGSGGYWSVTNSTLTSIDVLNEGSSPIGQNDTAMIGTQTSNQLSFLIGGAVGYGIAGMEINGTSTSSTVSSSFTTTTISTTASQSSSSSSYSTAAGSTKSPPPNQPPSGTCTVSSNSVLTGSYTNFFTFNGELIHNTQSGDYNLAIFLTPVGGSVSGFFVSMDKAEANCLLTNFITELEQKGFSTPTSFVVTVAPSDFANTQPITNLGNLFSLVNDLENDAQAVGDTIQLGSVSIGGAELTTPYVLNTLYPDWNTLIAKTLQGMFDTFVNPFVTAASKVGESHVFIQPPYDTIGGYTSQPYSPDFLIGPGQQLAFVVSLSSLPANLPVSLSLNAAGYESIPFSASLPIWGYCADNSNTCYSFTSYSFSVTVQITGSSVHVESSVSTSSSSSTNGGGGIPEFPFQSLITGLFVIVIVGFYLVIRRHAASRV
jgi:hypothetical protein